MTYAGKLRNSNKYHGQPSGSSTMVKMRELFQEIERLERRRAMRSAWVTRALARHPLPDEFTAYDPPLDPNMNCTKRWFDEEMKRWTIRRRAAVVAASLLLEDGGAHD